MSPDRKRDAFLRFVQRWRGVALMSVVVVATVWLAVTNQLILYIHPRYVVFTVIMAAIALVFVAASAFLREPHDHDEKPSRLQNGISLAAATLSVVIAAGLIVVPPATLTSATLAQREINGTGLGQETQSVAAASTTSDAAFAKFTVVDWSSLLRQTSDVAFYAGKPADVVGFVSADPDDPENMYFVSRFIITCCAVDAQPVGVPVYEPGWSDKYGIDDWVRVSGGFATNPSQASQQSIALLPETAQKVDQPGEPYLY
jgi:putative membrane protein